MTAKEVMKGIVKTNPVADLQKYGLVLISEDDSEIWMDPAARLSVYGVSEKVSLFLHSMEEGKKQSLVVYLLSLSLSTSPLQSKIVFKPLADAMIPVGETKRKKASVIRKGTNVREAKTGERALEFTMVAIGPPQVGKTRLLGRFALVPNPYPPRHHSDLI